MGNNIVTLYVNEKKYVFSMGDAYGQVPQSETLLDTLRNRLGLTGAKKSCDQGACGCCTVIKDGDAVPSCMQLTVDCDGCHITTIEGLADPETATGIFRSVCISVWFLHTRYHNGIQGVTG